MYLIHARERCQAECVSSFTLHSKQPFEMLEIGICCFIDLYLYLVVVVVYTDILCQNKSLQLIVRDENIELIYGNIAIIMDEMIGDFVEVIYSCDADRIII